MDITKNSNHTHHHSDYQKNRYFRRNIHVFWVLVTCFSVLPTILILLRLYRKVSEYQEARRQTRIRIDSLRSNENSVYAITIKQDYENLAPPRYSDVTRHPVLATYEKPPPYSPYPITTEQI